ncbi:MAG: V-type ATP synthase subunit B [Synergistaceae bacterium]|jgi:V/A-type H+-transporting ATPase subunit B|nr:V-type ATP synthase subunit B [Synergistaceae bacterium]
MALTEYTGIDKINGPIVMLKGTPGVGYDEVVEVVTEGGTRLGRAIMVSEDAVMVQVFAGTEGLVPATSRARFLGRPLEIALSPSILGRAFDGLGRPLDGNGPIYSDLKRNINGSPMNPMARVYPRDFINTGFSAIDVLMTLIRGQKLPIFSGNGLPHNQLAIQIASQARLVGAENFAVVFAGVGIKHDDAAAFTSSLSRRGANLVLFQNLADDPVIERIATPRYALTAAEYLAFDLGMHVLVIITDITSYCEALRELSVSRGEIPSRKGYPSYLYSDLASLYERAGVLRGKEGSITFLPILTMPNDDITNPVPDQTGFITEGQIVLSRELDAKGVYPPIDPLPSLSRLMKDGIGKGYTREDHPSVSSQLFACYSRVQEVKALAEVVGRDELGEEDKAYLTFGEEFEKTYVNQAKDENRDIGQSLDMSWRLLASLPQNALTRISMEDMERYIKPNQRGNPVSVNKAAPAEAASVEALSAEPESKGSAD